MKIKKIAENIKFLYHYTKRENVESILREKKIKSEEEYIFFTKELNESISLFESEMMSNRLFIDVDLKLKRREYSYKKDYVILKIPYYNDDKFYRFIFENQPTSSVYTSSIAHRGTLDFEKVKVIEFPKEKNYLSPFSKSAIAAVMVSTMLMLPNTVKAATWLDENKYNISWFLGDSRIQYNGSMRRFSRIVIH